MEKVLNEVSEDYHKRIKPQILAFLSDSEVRSMGSEIVSQVNGARQKVSETLSEPVKAGEIAKVKQGVSRGAPEASLIDEASAQNTFLLAYLCFSKNL